MSIMLFLIAPIWWLVVQVLVGVFEPFAFVRRLPVMLPPLLLFVYEMGDLLATLGLLEFQLLVLLGQCLIILAALASRAAERLNGWSLSQLFSSMPFFGILIALGQSQPAKLRAFSTSIVTCCRHNYLHLPAIRSFAPQGLGIMMASSAISKILRKTTVGSHLVSKGLFVMKMLTVKSTAGSLDVGMLARLAGLQKSGMIGKGKLQLTQTTDLAPKPRGLGHVPEINRTQTVPKTSCILPTQKNNEQNDAAKYPHLFLMTLFGGANQIRHGPSSVSKAVGKLQPLPSPYHDLRPKQSSTTMDSGLHWVSEYLAAIADHSGVTGDVEPEGADKEFCVYHAKLISPNPSAWESDSRTHHSIPSNPGIESRKPDTTGSNLETLHSGSFESSQESLESITSKECTDDSDSEPMSKLIKLLAAVPFCPRSYRPIAHATGSGLKSCFPRPTENKTESKKRVSWATPPASVTGPTHTLTAVAEPAFGPRPTPVPTSAQPPPISKPISAPAALPDPAPAPASVLDAAEASSTPGPTRAVTPTPTPATAESVHAPPPAPAPSSPAPSEPITPHTSEEPPSENAFAIALQSQENKKRNGFSAAHKTTSKKISNTAKPLSARDRHNGKTANKVSARQPKASARDRRPKSAFPSVNDNPSIDADPDLSGVSPPEGCTSSSANQQPLAGPSTDGQALPASQVQAAPLPDNSLSLSVPKPDSGSIEVSPKSVSSVAKAAPISDGTSSPPKEESASKSTSDSGSIATLTENVSSEVKAPPTATKSSPDSGSIATLPKDVSLAVQVAPQPGSTSSPPIQEQVQVAKPDSIPVAASTGNLAAPSTQPQTHSKTSTVPSGGNETGSNATSPVQVLAQQPDNRPPQQLPSAAKVSTNSTIPFIVQPAANTLINPVQPVVIQPAAKVFTNSTIPFIVQPAANTFINPVQPVVMQQYPSLLTGGSAHGITLTEPEIPRFDDMDWQHDEDFEGDITMRSADGDSGYASGDNSIVVSQEIEEFDVDCMDTDEDMDLPEETQQQQHSVEEHRYADYLQQQHQQQHGRYMSPEELHQCMSGQSIQQVQCLPQQQCFEQQQAQHFQQAPPQQPEQQPMKPWLIPRNQPINFVLNPRHPGFASQADASTLPEAQNLAGPSTTPADVVAEMRKVLGADVQTKVAKHIKTVEAASRAAKEKMRNAGVVRKGRDSHHPRRR
ncbi:MAG: hypothetical protein Q9168_000159 [Polycauliona sp. 1 TL-2023]